MLRCFKTHNASKEKEPLAALPEIRRAAGGFLFLSSILSIVAYASFVSGPLVVMVIAFTMPFGYTYVATSRKEND